MGGCSDEENGQQFLHSVFQNYQTWVFEQRSDHHHKLSREHQDYQEGQRIQRERFRFKQRFHVPVYFHWQPPPLVKVRSHVNPPFPPLAHTQHTVCLMCERALPTPTELEHVACSTLS